MAMAEKSPRYERIERPNSSEVTPRRTPDPAKARKVGKIAIRGTKDSRK